MGAVRKAICQPKGGEKMYKNSRDLKETYGYLLRLSLLLALCLHLVGFLAKKEIGLHPAKIRIARADTLWSFPEEPPPDVVEPPPQKKPDIVPAEPGDPDAVETIVTDRELWKKPTLPDPVPSDTFYDVYEEAPIPVVKVKPVYPPVAVAMELEGVVYVIAYIDITGKVVKAEVGKSAHESLNNAALESVMQWHFTPAKMMDKPVPVMVGIPIEFRLK